METYQLSLPAKESLENTNLSVAEQEKMVKYFQRRVGLNNLKYKEILTSIESAYTLTGTKAFECLYEAGFKLVSSASVGGCKASATIEHFFIKE